MGWCCADRDREGRIADGMEGSGVECWFVRLCLS